MCKDRLNCSKADGVLIKGAATVNAFRMRGIMALHPVARAAEAPKGQPAAIVFTKCGEVWRYA